MTPPLTPTPASAISDAQGFPALAAQLRPLRALLGVVRHGSTTQAARAMHLSQPAVARAVQQLEAGCGVPLFQRGARGMDLIRHPAEAELPRRAVNAAAARTEGAMTIIQHNILSKQMVSALV